MKKLVYIANIRLPTEKAHGIQIMEMCKAFTNQGIETTLVVPRRFNPIKEDPFVYHDISEVFTIKRLPCVDTVRFGRLGFWAEAVTFTAFVIWTTLFSDRHTTFYTRDELPALFLRILGKRVLWEGHTGQKNSIVKLLILTKVPFVVITDALKDLYLAEGVLGEKVHVGPDGADIDRFDITTSRNDAQEKLHLPKDKKIVLYKGHLYERKGAHILAEAIKYLPEDIVAVFIGGTEEDIQSFKNRFGSEQRVMILGNKPRQETPVYQKASHVLIIPNSAKDDVSKLFTSPMKLFGYIASKVPVIASDLPSLREILDESVAYFFAPDDPKSLAATIQYVLKNYSEAEQKARAAFNVAEKYSWDERAKNIITFAQKHFEQV